MENANRYRYEETPEGRIAAIAASVVDRIAELRKHPADFADIRDGIRAAVQREIVYARLAEARKCRNEKRVSELELDLVQIEEPDRLP